MQTFSRRCPGQSTSAQQTGALPAALPDGLLREDPPWANCEQGQPGHRSTGLLHPRLRDHPPLPVRGGGHLPPGHLHRPPLVCAGPPPTERHFYANSG